MRLLAWHGNPEWEEALPRVAFRSRTFDELHKIAAGVELNVKPVRLVDYQVLEPLQLDEFPFDGIVGILQREKFPGPHWFSRDLDASQVIAGLKRMVEGGFANCYADSTVGAAPIPLPPVPLMKDCWYGLTPAGADLLRYPAPWDYPLEEWTQPPKNSTQKTALDELRAHPDQWLFTPISAKKALAMGLGGCNSYLSTLRRFGGSIMVTHVFERGKTRKFEFLQGHFRSWLGDSSDGRESANFKMKREPLTNVDRMILDVLQDDVECVTTIVGLLNHELTPYRKWHFGQPFSEEEAKSSLTRLVSAGCVQVFEEGGDPVILRPSQSLEPNWDNLWFGLNPEGRRAASEGWLGRED